MGSIRMSLDMSEVDQAARNLEKVTAQAFAVPAVEELLQVWHDVAKQLAPIGETGDLFEGIKIVGVDPDAAGAQGVIVSSEHYSGWVNFGTERQAPQPFFSSGMLAVLDILRKVEKQYAEALEHLVRSGEFRTAA